MIRFARLFSAAAIVHADVFAKNIQAVISGGLFPEIKQVSARKLFAGT